MKNILIKFANYFDEAGLVKDADILDKVIAANNPSVDINTLKYIRDNYNFTNEAKDFFNKKLNEMLKITAKEKYNYKVKSPPKDSKKELNKVIHQYKNNKNPKKLQNDLDEYPEKLFLKILKDNDKDEKLSYLKSKVKEIIPIIKYYKNIYKRKRPTEYAKESGVDWSGDDDSMSTTDTPSYPSGHAAQGYYLAHLLSDKYPELKKEFMDLAESIAESRIDRGVHYPSDIVAGEDLGKQIFESKIKKISKDLRYHINNNISVIDNVFRPSSKKYFSLIKEAKQNASYVNLSVDEIAIMATDIGEYGFFAGKKVPLDFPLPNEEYFEKQAAEYKGKKVKLNRPMRSSGPKKYKVYVKNPKTGRVKKINFGDKKGGLKLRISDPKARRSFVARHKCKEKKDKMKAGYWACRIGRYPHLTGGKRYSWW